MKKFQLLAAVAVTVLFAAGPASAKGMSCTNDNMAKSIAGIPSMQDWNAKNVMMKEMMMANSSIAKGDMRGACKSYRRAQGMK